MATILERADTLDPAKRRKRGEPPVIGGGYALVSGRKLAFLVDYCDGEALTSVMSQIVGQPERQEALKSAIERRQMGEAA